MKLYRKIKGHIVFKKHKRSWAGRPGCDSCALYQMISDDIADETHYGCKLGAMKCDVCRTQETEELIVTMAHQFHWMAREQE